MKHDDPMPSSDDSFLESFRDLLTESAPEAVAAAALEVIGRHVARRPPVPAVYDSVFEGVPIGVRGTGPRMITFESDQVTVEIEIIAGRQIQIVGQVAPPAAGTVEVSTDDGLLSALVDDLGRFQISRVAHGPFQIAFRSDASGFETDWITL